MIYQNSIKIFQEKRKIFEHTLKVTFKLKIKNIIGPLFNLTKTLFSGKIFFN